MRGGQMPQTSPLRSHHPTAPKSADPYMSGGEPSPGFPGLNRTGSQRRNYAPSPAEDPRSTYSRYNRSDPRPPSTGPYQNTHSQPRRDQESVSPLRQSRSFNPSDFTHVRPGLSRTSSKYAHTGGERTAPNDANTGRSASTRYSPTDRDQGPFGQTRSPEERAPRPRRRSHSPPTGNQGPRFQYASESSSEGDDTPPPQDRKKASIRRAQTRIDSDGPGLSGYFPKHNYTRVVEDESTYDYPAPDAKGPPTRKPFSNLSPVDAHDVNANEPPFRTPSQEDVSNTKYEPQLFPSPAHGWPVWALPSSICPRTSHVREELEDVPEDSICPEFLKRPMRGYTMLTDFFCRTNGNSPPKNSDRNGFSAEEWHEHFDNHADMFKPTDIPSRDRQSPSKNSRARAGSSRSYAQTKEKRRDAIDAEIDPITAGMRHVDSNKADAFQPPKLAPDFVDQVNSGRRASRSTQAETQNGNAYENGHANGRLATDDMDLDSPSTGPSSATDSEHYNVTVEEEHSPRVKPQDAPQQSSNRHTSDAGARGNGFSMDELKNAGPFAPSQTGLKDLNDLSNSLPFKSRPAENIDTLHRTNSNAMRDLNLPRPPKTPHCPADNEITSDTWQKFAESMTNYMHDWNKFNAAMVEHFRLRQEAVTHGMYRNWLVAWGDGASAEDFEASHGSDRAGYATYMTWLEDDKRCRAWWDVAFEEHIRCMEGLGRVRKCVKAINTAQEAAK